MPTVHVGKEEIFISDTIPEEARDDIYLEVLERQRAQREGTSTPVAPAENPAAQPYDEHQGGVSDDGYTTYHVRGKQYQLSNNLTEDQKNEYLQDKLDSTPISSSYSQSSNPEAITTESLQHDPDWLHASKVTYAKREGKPFSGTDAEAADYGVN